MRIQKELAKISKDLQKISKRIKELTLSLPTQKSYSNRTGTQTVLDIIRRSRNGIDAQSLITKTGFDDKKIRNILFKTLVDGKIERVRRGVYKMISK